MSDSHFAASFGGYDTSEDDFDYDDFLAEEFPEQHAGMRSRDRWRIVSILLLLVFLILLLVPLLQFV